MGGSPLEIVPEAVKETIVRNMIDSHGESTCMHGLPPSIENL
jgi:hypothetical protein